MVEATGNTPFSQRTPADFITLGDPRLTQVDTWLAITPANTVIVTHGETEFTGAPTGILMLVAEELNITDMSMMVYAHPESWLNSIGGGGGSGAIATRSTVARAAAAQALKLMLQAASTKLGVPVGSLSASNGVISGGGQQVKYSDLYGGQNFNFDLATLTPAVTTTTGYIPGQGNTKPVSQYQLVGRLVHRIDIPAKIAGTYTYIQNVRIPGMVHARRVRPRGAGANASQNHYPLSVDKSSVAHIPGVQVVQIGNFLAVVAPKEYDAIQAAAQLKVVWKDDPKFSVGSGNYWSWLRQAGGHQHDQPGPLGRRHGERPRGDGVGSEDRLGDVPVPLQHVRADRAALRGRRRARRQPERSDAEQRDDLLLRAGDEPRLGHGCGRRVDDADQHDPRGAADPDQHPAEPDPDGLVRGLRLLRRRSEPAGLRGGRGDLGHDRQAGADAVDALGPERLGQLGPVADVRRHDGCELGGVDRRFRLDVVRTGRQHPRHRPGAPRTGDLAGDAAERRPDAVGRRLDRNPVREHELRRRRTSSSGGCWRRRSRSTAAP